MDLTQSSTLEGSISAPARGGQKGKTKSERDVCKRLLQRMNQDAGFGLWELVEQHQTTQEDETDCIARATQQTLNIQVTRAPQDRDLWKPDATTRRVEQRYDFGPAEAADQITAAIKRKSKLYPFELRRELVLAVDVLETPGHSLDQVVRRLDAPWLASLGFMQVWLVGLNPELCVRIHPR